MRILAPLCLLALSGCASLGLGPPHGCAGPVRPANPNGSVLLAPAVDEAPRAEAPSARAAPTGTCR